MRFVVDMNLSPAWVDHLSAFGHDAVHWSAIGKGDAPDVDVMRWAAEHARVVLTNDLDFGAILAASGDQGPSVIQLRSDLLHPSDIGGKVLTAIEQVGADLEAGALLTIDARRARLRILPIG